jgi:hypothetical protein
MHDGPTKVKARTVTWARQAHVRGVEVQQASHMRAGAGERADGAVMIDKAAPQCARCEREDRARRHIRRCRDTEPPAARSSQRHQLVSILVSLSGVQPAQPEASQQPRGKRSEPGDKGGSA